MAQRKPCILITAVQVPFTRGGAEVLVDGLKRELLAAGFDVDVVQLPFNAQPKESLLNQVAMWRSLDLTTFQGRKVDLVIGTKFPSYLISHPNKVVWMVHQHRQIYDLYGSRYGDFTSSPEDEALRRMLTLADLHSLKECKKICTISGNVAKRLKRYLGIEAEVLPPPLPLGARYLSSPEDFRGDYILSVGRLCSIKRVDMLIKAMPLIRDTLSLKIVGQPDEPGIERYLESEIEKHHLRHRVQFVGRVTDEELIELYSKAFAVYYAPYDEDYGFVTLEALASGKPVVTAKDSGGVLEFITDRLNGIVTEPSETAVSEAFNLLLDDSALYSSLTTAALASHLPSAWKDVVSSLTSSIQPSDSQAIDPEATIVTAQKIAVSDELPLLPTWDMAQKDLSKGSGAEIFFKRES